MLSLFFYLFISTAYAADMVVIRASDNTEYFKGQLLHNHAQVKLPDDAEVTVVFASGEVLTVQSGFKGALIDPSTSIPEYSTQMIAELSEFLLKEQPVIRSPAEYPPSAWQVDMSNNKRHYCVIPSQPVILWRPSGASKTAGVLEIKHSPTNKRVKTVWPAHKTTLGWPKDLSVVYEDAYSVEVKSLTGQRFFKKLVLHKIPDDLPTKSHQVVWMVGRGCIPQANLLLASLK